MTPKHLVAIAVGLAIAGGASAATQNLGAVTIGVPVSFGSYVPSAPFTDTFMFSLSANGGSGYSVANWAPQIQPTAYPAGSAVQFGTFLQSVSLYSNPDGTPDSIDDVLLLTSNSPGGASITLSAPANGGGNFFLRVTGAGFGTSGGLYTGAIAALPVTQAVPEPETYALMLAGLAGLGFVARRRRAP